MNTRTQTKEEILTELKIAAYWLKEYLARHPERTCNQHDDYLNWIREQYVNTRDSDK